MILEIPVKQSTKIWFGTFYGAGVIDIRRNTRLLGPLVYSYFVQYAVGQGRASDTKNWKVETITFNLPFEVNLSLLDDARLEAFGLILECLVDTYRFGFVDGFTDVMPSFNTSIRRFIKKYNWEDLPKDDISSAALLKDAHRFHSNMVQKAGAKIERKGFGTGNTFGAHLEKGLSVNDFAG